MTWVPHELLCFTVCNSKDFTHVLLHASFARQAGRHLVFSCDESECQHTAEYANIRTLLSYIVPCRHSLKKNTLNVEHQTHNIICSIHKVSRWQNCSIGNTPPG